MIENADKEYDVWLYYRGYDSKLDNKIARLSKCYTGSGSDGTWRDHSFTFKSEKAAKDFCARVRKTLGRKVSIETL